MLRLLMLQTPPPGEWRASQPFNRGAELASDAGRVLELPALTHQMFPTTLRALRNHSLARKNYGREWITLAKFHFLWGKLRFRPGIRGVVGRGRRWTASTHFLYEIINYVGLRFMYNWKHADVWRPPTSFLGLDPCSTKPAAKSAWDLQI